MPHLIRRVWPPGEHRAHALHVAMVVATGVVALVDAGPLLNLASTIAAAGRGRVPTWSQVARAVLASRLCSLAGEILDPAPVLCVVLSAVGTVTAVAAVAWRGALVRCS